MCCFTGKTEVHGTTIFARITAPNRQALVYQMRYAAAEPTAMILPLPVALPAGEASVLWKDLKAYASFFTDLAVGFPSNEIPSNGIFRSKSMTAAAEVPIPVHEVGDFVASFVPSVDDFHRLDPRFVISKEVWSHIPAYRDYAFAVFQLKELAGTPHPIAFEFQSRLAKQVFFPTVHIHDGTVHDKGDFDHALYVQDAHFDALVSDYEGPTHADKKTGLVRSTSKVGMFADVGRSVGVLDGNLLVHRTTMKGLLPNVDTFMTTEAAAANSGSIGGEPIGAARSAGCGRCDVAGAGAKNVKTFGASGMLMAGLGWVIRRRDVLRRKG